MKRTSDKTVLVVDKEPDMRSLLASCMSDAGFNVEIAVDERDALKKIRTRQPDLMTLDLATSGQSGRNLMHRLRRNKDWADIPVVVITSCDKNGCWSDRSNRLQAYASTRRTKHFLKRPITPRSLVKDVQTILDVEAVVEIDRPKAASAETAEIKRLVNDSAYTLKRVLEVLSNGRKEPAVSHAAIHFDFCPMDRQLHPR